LRQFYLNARTTDLARTNGLMRSALSTGYWVNGSLAFAN
jgi:hypothetical protein